MKKQFFAFAFTVAMMNNILAFNPCSTFDTSNEQSKWAFLENKFVTQIAKEKQYIWTHVGGAAAALTVLGSFARLYSLDSQQSQRNFVSNAFTTGNVYAGVGTVSAGALLASYLECYVSAQADRNAVDSFFQNWDENQFFVPEELEEAFDLLAKNYKTYGKQALLEHANEIVETLQFHVMRHFEKRYEKLLQLSAASALKETKTVVDILKGSIESAGKLAGGK